ncbi:tubulin-like doman-containing protein [uncultured Actinomyces sp.]|uniref:tubulin-like doman-containing protein n=1 Tax=uncultured Actinomyces sp. TaxID=249061 RepID=UPI002806320A|nr:tubulin-like doman-containing protein [uncultured Actinomyces sp.]
MRKVLVVGCGGSGAKTLAYMMDQLHADLAAYGIEKIPGCWQFLSVDTPLQEEKPGGLGSVTQQGGAYVACGVSAGSYSVVDDSLTHQVQSKGPAGLRQLATWMPGTVQDVPFPVTVGAGQCRGIGRLLILDRLSAVSQAVQDALARMASTQSVSEAAEVARRVPGVGEPPATTAPPMVLVVSSMAGGSGASMTLDVCRVIAGTQTTPAIDPQLISVFLYTAEVFNEVPKDKKDGMPGNTLAMLGEIIAAQSSNGGKAARLDEELYSLMGGATKACHAFKRVIPIGLKAGGTGAVFGDGTTSGVFRGMGRGLARYIASPAFESYVQFDIANKVDIPNHNAVSWGVDPTETAWGSFGYASLSTGRDRYAEYASQRMARRSIDHLLDGFRSAGDFSGDAQRLAALWQARMPEELAKMHLPQPTGQTVMAGGQAVDAAAQAWLMNDSATANASLIWARASEMAQQVMSTRPQAAEMPLSDWIVGMNQWLGSVEPQIMPQLATMAVEYTRARAQEVHTAIVEQVRTDLADLGLPYALQVIGELRGEAGVIKRLAGSLAGMGMQQPQHALVLPQDFVAPLTARVKETLTATGEGQWAEQVREKAAVGIYQWLVYALAQNLAKVLDDMVGSALKPLEYELNEKLKVLTHDRQSLQDVAGVADVATDLYSAWPTEPTAAMTSEQVVPQRFSTAHNEVVLMDVATYPSAFEEHVVEAVPPAARGGFDQAYREAVREIIRGEWEQGSGAPAPADLLEIASPWVPAGLPGVMSQMPAPAQYEVRLSRAQVLGRARAFVGRRGEAFESFVSQSLRDYLTDPAAGEFEQARRADEVLEGMQRAMAMARPLVQVDAQVFQRLHGSAPALSFNFSSVPFRHTKVATELVTYASHETSFDGPAVAQTIEQALSDDQVSRVDVFGSYPRTLPVAYSGLLKSVSTAWHHATGSSGARASFWQFRRARPLPGGLPMGDDDRRAMVHGWWVAFFSGGIQRPGWGMEKDTDPISVWDADSERFVPFPAPMLTSHSQMVTPNSALAAVLESILLAYLDVDDSLSVFTPWQVLRRWADTSDNAPSSKMGVRTPTQQAISELLGHGEVAGLPTPAFLEGLTQPEERRQALATLCDNILADLDQRYLPGEGKQDGPGSFTNFRSRELVDSAPLSIDLAQEMYDELTSVREVIASVAPAGAAATRRSPLEGGMVY